MYQLQQKYVVNCIICWVVAECYHHSLYCWYFINNNYNKANDCLCFYVTREDSPDRILFIENLLEDRTESTMAYHEFLTFIQKQLEKINEVIINNV